MKACRRRSSGSSASSSSRDSGLDLRGMGGDEVGCLADRQDLDRLLVGDADAVAVLQLDHELDQVERVRLEVLPEAGGVADAPGIDLQLGGQMLADAVENPRFQARRRSLGVRRRYQRSRTARPRPPRAPPWCGRPCPRRRRAGPASPRARCPCGPKLPCATTTGLRSPSRIAPPTFSGSKLVAELPELAADQQAAEARHRPDRIRDRISAPKTFSVLSSTFSATLPVKPSATTTSTPARRDVEALHVPGEVQRAGLGDAGRAPSSTSGVPLPDSSPTESRPTDGPLDPHARPP